MAAGFRKSLFGFNCADVMEYIEKSQKTFVKNGLLSIIFCKNDGMVLPPFSGFLPAAGQIAAPLVGLRPTPALQAGTAPPWGRRRGAAPLRSISNDLPPARYAFHAMPNSRLAFRQVISTISSAAHPRISASRSATRGSMLLSQRLPRYGSGAM